MPVYRLSFCCKNMLVVHVHVMVLDGDAVPALVLLLRADASHSNHAA